MRLPLRCAPGGFQMQVIAETRRIMKADTSRTWAVGGHSHGGVIASRFAAEYPRELQSLILIGTSHPRDTDLSSLDRPVTKIFGTRDGVASESKIRANAHLLPASTSWVRIEGGNHSQFGWYWFQLGDHAATITRAAQQAATLEAICRTLELRQPLTFQSSKVPTF
jgi:pimeloyl-ACP methyl ester carboxylesterase